MEQVNNAKARYIPTRVAVCKRCGGKGVVFEYSDENRTKAVSYTHLDVYKRQVGECSMAYAKAQLKTWFSDPTIETIK